MYRQLLGFITFLLASHAFGGVTDADYLEFLTDRTVIIESLAGDDLHARGCGAIIGDRSEVLTSRRLLDPVKDSMARLFDPVGDLLEEIGFRTGDHAPRTELDGSVAELVHRFRDSSAFVDIVPIESLQRRDLLYGVGLREDGGLELRKGDVAFVWHPDDDRDPVYNSYVEYHQSVALGRTGPRYSRLLVCFLIGDSGLAGSPVIDATGRFVGIVLNGDGVWFYVIPAEDLNDQFDLNMNLVSPAEGPLAFQHNLPMTSKDTPSPTSTLPPPTPQKDGAFAFALGDKLTLRLQRIKSETGTAQYTCRLAPDDVKLLQHGAIATLPGGDRLAITEKSLSLNPSSNLLVLDLPDNGEDEIVVTIESSGE